MSLTQNWLIGITGGIAAYKTIELVRQLIKQGAGVRVVLSQNAHHFVSKMTLQAVSGHSVYEQPFDPDFEAAMGHIELAKWADHILIAPLSANRMAALAQGFADDLLTTLCLASKAKLWIAPAMNQQMWAHAASQANLALLKARGAICLGPDFGVQACGDFGWGRMLEPESIIKQIQQTLDPQEDALVDCPLIFQNIHLLITAGPTREYLDPVRFISNKSSGKMGYALAEIAHALGAKVTLVSGPVTQPKPEGIRVISVESAQEMHDCALLESKKADIFIGCAAVADFRFEKQYDQKFKKQSNEDQLLVTMVKNPDILKTIAQQENRPFCVGFAAETNNTYENAASKLKDKKLDIIALNDVSRHDIGFDSDDNQLTILTEKECFTIEKAPKRQIAYALLKKIREIYDAKNQT